MRFMKRLTLALLILLCLCLAAFALAEPGAALVREGLEDTDWVSGTGRLKIEGNPVNNYRAYSMNALDGTQLTEAVYARFEGKKGYVLATLLTAEDLMNADGLLDTDGNVLIPCEYGDIDVLSTEWALGVKLSEATADQYDYRAFIGDGYYLIDTVDVYHLPEGEKLATLARSEFLDADAVNHCINIENRTTGEVTTYDAGFNTLGTVKYSTSEDYAPADYSTFYENRHYGIKDAAGNVVMEPTYATIYTAYRGMVRVQADDGKEGLITEQGALVVPTVYDKILSVYNLPEDPNSSSGYVAAGYVAVEQDGKVGYVDLAGNVTCEPKYAKSAMEVSGASALLTDLEGNLRIIAADGVETPVEGYERVSALSYGSGVFYRVTDANYNIGMIDWHGNVIFPCEYRGIDLSGDGQYALVDVDYSTSNLYGLTYPEATGAPAAWDDAADAPAADPVTAQISGVASLLDSAMTLIDADLSGNGEAVTGLLHSAITLLGEGNDAAANLLQSAVTLIQADAQASAATVSTLLQNAAGLLTGK